MPMAQSRQLNGYEIIFHLNDGNLDGIAFHPDTVNLDDPAFLAALHQAAKIFPYANATALVQEYSANGPYDEAMPHSLRDKLLEAIAVMDEGIRLGYISDDERPDKFVDSLLRNKKRPKSPLPERKKKHGFVYILKSEAGQYKIGRAKNPDDRQETFTIKLPFRTEYELVIPSDDYEAFELELQRRFASKRLDGEWFALTSEDIEILKGEYTND